MKNTIIKNIAGLIMLLMLLSDQIGYSQNWQFTNTLSNGFIGSTSPNPNGVTGIGIGDFSAGNLNAALHVNTNLTVTNTGFSAGEVFRTDGPSGLTHAWRMHSSNISSSLKFSILNLALENYL